MITPLSGWTFEPSAGLLQLRLDDRPFAGVIRYLERLRPSPPLPELLRTRVAAIPGFASPRLRAVEELRSDEGEEAALVTLDGELDGAPVEVTLGWVWIDDFCSETAALSRDPAEHPRFAQAVRTLVLGDRHFMTQRRRRYRHRGPLGWRAVTRQSTLDLVWLPPDDDGGEITVAAAVPSLAEEALSVAETQRLAARLEILGHVELVCPPLAPGLVGRLWRFAVRFPDGSDDSVGSNGVRSVAVLTDASFTYQLSCETRTARASQLHPLFMALIASVEPIAPIAPIANHAGAVALFGWLAQ
jgi:hypothetical protein